MESRDNMESEDYKRGDYIKAGLEWIAALVLLLVWLSIDQW